MNPWLAALLSLLVAAGGAGLGVAASRLPRHWWLIGYLVPLGVIVAFAVAVRRPEWALHPALAWVFVGRWKLALMATVVAMIFSALVPRLPQVRQRRALGLLVAVAVLYFSVWPAVAMAANRPFLTALTTRIAADGICWQSTDYTCGPAAAVTGLHRLGLKAGEGELALPAGTSSAAGTPPDVLAQVLTERFGAEGLRAELRRFRTVDELRAAGLTLVIVTFGLFLDHWLTVLEFNDREVVVADPLSGEARLSHEEFRARWRFIGITLQRAPPGR
jgi:predicted double-glycine peptidase